MAHPPPPAVTVSHGTQPSVVVMVMTLGVVVVHGVVGMYVVGIYVVGMYVVGV